MKLIFGLILIILLNACAVYSEPFVRPDYWAKPVMGSQLDNFYKVDEHLYRSSQPGSQDVPALKKMGIKSALNLRNFHDDKNELKNSDIQLLRVPMNAGEVTSQQISNALRQILDADGPVLVHCWHGSDRTGVVVAAYRMVVMGWSKKQAINEFIHGGYGYHQSFYPNLETLLRNLDVEKLKVNLKLLKN